MPTNQNGHRIRFTASTVRTLPIEALEEAYAKSHLYRHLVNEGVIEPKLVERLKANRQHVLLRMELLSRGFKREDLDAEPEIPESLQKEIDDAKLAKDESETEATREQSEVSELEDTTRRVSGDA